MLAEVVWYWMAVGAWNFSGGCVVIHIGPCLVLMKGLCRSGCRSVRGYSAEAVW
jgi:hypothetical protein